MKKGLSRVEQSLVLERLLVFKSGFLMAAARAVCADAEASPEQVEAVVKALAEDGVLEQRRLASGATRYSWPEGSGELAFDPETAEGRTLSRRHADWMLRYMLETKARLGSEDQEAILDEIEADRPNLDAALAWAAGQNVDPELSMRLAIACFRFWFVRGHFQEGADYTLHAISRVPGRQDPVKLRALNEAGAMLEALGDYKRSKAAFEFGLSLARALGDRSAEAAILANLAIVQVNVGEFEAAAKNVEAAVDILRSSKNEPKLASTLINLAVVRLGSGSTEGVAQALDEADDLCYRLGDHFQRSYVSFNRGDLARMEGDQALAETSYRRSLEQALVLGDVRGMAMCLRALGELASQGKEYLRAAKLFGAAEHAREAGHVPIPPIEMNRAVVSISEAKTGLEESAFLTAWQEGRGGQLEDIVKFAIA